MSTARSGRKAPPIPGACAQAISPAPNPRPPQPAHPHIPMAERKALPIPDACAYAGVKRSSIYNLLAAKKLRDVKIAGRRVILVEDLDRLLSGEVA